MSEFACLAALDSLERRSSLPESCDPAPLVDAGLIEASSAGDRWRLTVNGRLMLANLRSLERQRHKA